MITEDSVPLPLAPGCWGSSRTPGCPWRLRGGGQSPEGTRLERECLACDVPEYALGLWHSVGPTPEEKGGMREEEQEVGRGGRRRRGGS